MAVKVRVNQADYSNRILFAFFKDSADPEKFFIFNGKDTWEEYKFGEAVGPERFTLSIPPEAKDEILQQMANLLGAMGYKPEKLKAAVQEIERLENHLLDAINVRDRLLTIVEGKNAKKD